jgi:hypothetical protein
MPLDIFTPTELYGVMFGPNQRVVESRWRNQFFRPEAHYSDAEEIMFDKIDGSRPIAPFMLPNAPGKPIFRREGERIQTFKPAYTKPKDAVKPSEALARRPGELTKRLNEMSPQERFDMDVVRIARYHREAIERLWEMMSAKALIDGRLTINYTTDSGSTAHSVDIDYGRAASHTETLLAGSRWGDAGVSIFGHIQRSIDTVAMADFGGSVSDVLLGAEAAAAFMEDTEIVDKKLNTLIRGTEGVRIEQGLLRQDPIDPFTLLGTLGSGVRVWRVAGRGNTFQNNDGSFSPILGSKQMLLVSPAVEGVFCFGAIQDIGYGLEATDVFTKMFDQDDPSARFILSQSAPLPVIVNPDSTFLSNVVG